MDTFGKIHVKAVKLLRELCTAHGILASLIETENYKRIWARDSIVCGLAGIILNDEQIIEGLRNSLLTLSEGQHELGMIPSNVDPNDPSRVSYGSLAGRIDTNSWFIIGVSLYVRHTNDVDFLSNMEPAVEKCRSFLQSIELNNKGWIYTPLSGNWADEYPVHGYTLYDNCLRIWAERLWSEIEEDGIEIPDEVIEKTRINFWPEAGIQTPLIYHIEGFKTATTQQKGYFLSYLLPGYYDQRFDAAGNALAMLVMGMDSKQQQATRLWLQHLESEMGKRSIPAFWPKIEEHDDDWKLLRNNYSYNFKNKPGEFHNGGIWPVWMGLYCMGLAANGLKDEAEKVISEFIKTVEDSDSWKFDEYINSNNFEFQGKVQMGYTASGIVFMGAALEDTQNFKELFLS